LTASIYKHFAPLALVVKHGFLPHNFSRMGSQPAPQYFLHNTSIVLAEIPARHRMSQQPSI
jgi:hypothetical protein